MYVYCNGTARIGHRSSGEVHEVVSDLLDWYVACSDERQMGPELRHKPLSSIRNWENFLGVFGSIWRASRTIRRPTPAPTTWSKISTTDSSTAVPSRTTSGWSSLRPTIRSNNSKSRTGRAPIFSREAAQMPAIAWSTGSSSPSRSRPCRHTSAGRSRTRSCAT